jgi:SAM-dependent methyltransferase
MEDYFSGKKLIGDDYDFDHLTRWYQEEEDAYYDLFIQNQFQPFRNNDYLHNMYGFNYLRSLHRVFSEVLGFGSGDGRELQPIGAQIQNVTIVESSAKYFKGSQPHAYVKAEISGDLPFPSDRFDLIVCFATLHHVANVSKVVSEFSRCLRPGGFCLIKEPITSIGDWRVKRGGCTQNERGIPLKLFDTIVHASGFKIIKRNLHETPFVGRLWTKCGIQVFNNPFAMIIDRCLSVLLSFNIRYHRTKVFHKLMPNYVFYVLTKSR